MSAVTGIYLFRLLLNIIFFALRSFFTLTNSTYPDEMPHDGISPVCKCKKYVRKIYFKIEMQPNIFFLKLFLVPYMYAFTCCNLRVGKFDVSASNMILFLASIFHQAQVNGQWKRIRHSQLVQANIAGTQ